jgi:hypothetical protein
VDAMTEGMRSLYTLASTLVKAAATELPPPSRTRKDESESAVSALYFVSLILLPLYSSSIGLRGATTDVQGDDEVFRREFGDSERRTGTRDFFILLTLRAECDWLQVTWVLMDTARKSNLKMRWWKRLRSYIFCVSRPLIRVMRLTLVVT